MKDLADKARNGTIIHWPNGIKAKGEIRSQFHHVIDVAPTVLVAAHVSEAFTLDSPSVHRGFAQEIKMPPTAVGGTFKSSLQKDGLIKFERAQRAGGAVH